MRYVSLFITLLIATQNLVFAADGADSVAINAAPDSVPTARVRKSWNPITWALDYLDSTNKPKENKKLDFSILGGPYYSSDTKFGVGLLAMLEYRTNLADTLTPASDVGLVGDLCTGDYIKVGIVGKHIFHLSSARIQYELNFLYAKRNYWGIGYDMDSNDANRTTYKFINPQFRSSMMWQLLPNFYLGPVLDLEYIHGYEFGNIALWNGQAATTMSSGAGVGLQYDSRDVPTNAYSGIFLAANQYFFPKFIGNKYAFSATDLTVAGYVPMWKGSVLAMMGRSRLTYGNTPWGMMSTLGGNRVMRGYYEGQYRDKSSADISVELRQHIYGRSGIVLWVGTGTVFDSLKDIRFNTLLPNYGLGYRWEFKKRVNIRLDYGFGRGQSALIFNINEAF